MFSFGVPNGCGGVAGSVGNSLCGKSSEKFSTKLIWSENGTVSGGTPKNYLGTGYAPVNKESTCMLSQNNKKRDFTSNGLV